MKTNCLEQTILDNFKRMDEVIHNLGEKYIK